MYIFCGYGSGVYFSFILDITVPFWEKYDGMKFISQWFLLVAVYFWDIFQRALNIFWRPLFLM